MLDNDESEVDICRIIDKDSEFELNNYGSNRIFGWLYCVGLEIDVTELENIRTDFASGVRQFHKEKIVTGRMRPAFFCQILSIYMLYVLYFCVIMVLR